MDLREQLLSKYDTLVDNNHKVISELKRLNPEQLSYKQSAESWSIIQVLNHLLATEQGTLGYVKKKLKYGGLKEVNWSSGFRAFLMRSVNNSSIRFKMPSALSAPSEEGSLSSIEDQWSTLRDDWKDCLRTFPNESLDKAVFRHPIFGRLSFLQTMDSMITHQNHHVKQIKRIKEKLSL